MNIQDAVFAICMALAVIGSGLGFTKEPRYKPAAVICIVLALGVLIIFGVLRANA